MKKAEATKAKKIIEAWIKKKKYDTVPTVRIDDNDKQHYGINIYTDGDSYDDLFTNEGYYVDEYEAKEFGIKPGYMGGSLDKLEAHLNQKMHWRKGKHYFEPYGGGRVDIY